MTIYPEHYRENLLKYTRTAFNLIPEIESPRILDVGCGTGLPSLCLAELSGGNITGVDNNQAALSIFGEKIRGAGLEQRVEAQNRDINNLGFNQDFFDIIWAEGAIAGVGFQNALKLFGRFLKTDGYLVIHDDAKGYKEKLSTAEESGFLVFGYFLITKDVWWNEYYKLLENDLLSATEVAPETMYSLDALRNEIKKFKEIYEKFASVFFILEKRLLEQAHFK